MIGTSAYIGIGIMIAGGVLLPVAVTIWWLKKTKERFTTVLAGAATWILFSMLLEKIPIYFLFNPKTRLGQSILGSVVLYTAIGALLAGIFEETGRLVAFRTVLRNRTNRETGLSHGIGHGGFEALFMMGVTGIEFIAFAVMINAGTFQSLVDQTAATGVDTSSLQAIPAQIAAITPVYGLVSLLERVSAMFLHAGLSILVFHAVRERRTGLYLLAIILHALFDVPAALYQTGVLNLYVVEAILAVYAVLFFVAVDRVLYRKEGGSREPQPTEGAKC
ncbi:MAG: YhfC family intramembrane metalloprotease [Spirochaetales bacterium]|nr:YhfC family intramembrane metalloprotease [Spirochaetales bacterium]